MSSTSQKNPNQVPTTDADVCETVNRAEYQRPRLQEFGSVGALTQSGTAGVAEMGMGMGGGMMGSPFQMA